MSYRTPPESAGVDDLVELAEPDKTDLPRPDEAEAGAGVRAGAGSRGRGASGGRGGGRPGGSEGDRTPTSFVGGESPDDGDGGSGGGSGDGLVVARPVGDDHDEGDGAVVAQEAVSGDGCCGLNFRNRSVRGFLGVVVVAFLVLGVVLYIVVRDRGGGDDDKDPSKATNGTDGATTVLDESASSAEVAAADSALLLTPVPSSSPSAAPVLVDPESIRAAAIEAAVRELVLDPSVLDDPASSQSLALRWMVEEDFIFRYDDEDEEEDEPDDVSARALTLVDDRTDPLYFLQRFSLASLYFASEGDDWTSCGSRYTNLTESPDCHWDGAPRPTYAPEDRFCGWWVKPSCFLGSPWLNGSAHHCDWDSVSCDHNRSAVLDIYLSKKGIGGTLPEEIGNFPALVRFSVNENDVGGSLPVSIGNLTNAQELTLYINSFTGTVPETLGDLPELRSLTIHGNSLSGVIPSGVCEDTRTIKTSWNLNLMSDCETESFDCPCCTTCCNEQKLCCPNITNSPWCSNYFCECFFYWR